MKKCFVICPISTPNSLTRERSDKLLEHIIEPALKNTGFEVIRADKVEHSTSITELILQYLRESDLVIADLTDHNPNCFYEIGYRYALGLPMIYLKEKDSTIPFDISMMRTIDYAFDVVDVKTSIKSITDTINSIDFENSSNVTTPRTNTDTSIPYLLTIQKNTEKILEILHSSEDKKKSSLDSASVAQIFMAMMQNPDGARSVIDIAKNLKQEDSSET